VGPTLPRTPVMQWTSDFGFEDMQDDQVFNSSSSGADCRRASARTAEPRPVQPRFRRSSKTSNSPTGSGCVSRQSPGRQPLIRPLTFAVFCDGASDRAARCMFSRFHADAAVQDYAAEIFRILTNGLR
jgi:hypothetical protein